MRLISKARVKRALLAAIAFNAVAACSLAPGSASSIANCSVDSCCDVWSRPDCTPSSWATPVALPDGAAEPLAVVTTATDTLVVVAGTEGEPGQLIAVEGRAGDYAVSALNADLEGNAQSPRIAASPVSRRVAVAWRQIAGSQTGVYAAYSGSEGQWRTPQGGQDVLSEPADAYEPDVAVTIADELLVAWNQWTGANYQVALAGAKPSDLGWDVPIREQGYLSAAVNFANRPRIAVGANHEALISWYQAPETTDLMVYATTRQGAGDSFDAQRSNAFISAPAGPVENPWPAISASGAMAIAWRQEYAVGAYAVFAAHRRPTEDWVKPTSLADGISLGHGPVNDVQAAFLGENVVVVWRERAADGSTEIWWAIRGYEQGQWQVERLQRLSQGGSSLNLAVDANAAAGMIGWIDNDMVAPATAFVRFQLDPTGEVSRKPLDIVESDSGLAQSNLHLVAGAGAARFVAVWREQEDTLVATYR